jgi:hypothetical protein
LIEATPLKRGAESGGVGWWAVFLASDEASFDTFAVCRFAPWFSPNVAKVTDRICNL